MQSGGKGKAQRPPATTTEERNITSCRGPEPAPPWLAFLSRWPRREPLSTARVSISRDTIIAPRQRSQPRKYSPSVEPFVSGFLLDAVFNVQFVNLDAVVMPNNSNGQCSIPPKAQINTDKGRGTTADEFFTLAKLMLVVPNATEVV